MERGLTILFWIIMIGVALMLLATAIERRRHAKRENELLDNLILATRSLSDKTNIVLNPSKVIKIKKPSHKETIVAKTKKK